MRQASVERAIALLQEGREAQAEKLLERLGRRQGGNATARLLLAQIRQPPETLLGESFERMTVEAGDSLSKIAGRVMNNELLFYALARLNDIEVPRLLRVGQEIRIPKIEVEEAVEQSGPEALADSTAVDEAVDDEADEAADDPEPQLVDTARGLIDRERYSQAYALLLSAARAGKLESGDTELLADVAVELAAAACAGDDPERALEILAQASPWVIDSGEKSRLSLEREHVEARRILDDAEAALKRSNYDRAFDLLMQAQERSSDLAERHGERTERLADVLSMRFHDQALSAWRDQRVDESVLLWERVVRIAPGFVPAQRYLERARRVRRELENLENS